MTYCKITLGMSNCTITKKKGGAARVLCIYSYLAKIT